MIEAQAIGDSDFLINDSDDPDELDRLLQKLNYFFLDPIEKWKRKNTKPWKLLIQIIKLIIFTHQLILFGTEMSQFITYKDEMQNTFKLLLLESWEPSVDALPYPGPYVPFTVYRKEKFFSSINHAISTYANIEDISVGPFGYHSRDENSTRPLVELCLTNYKKAEFEPNQFKYNYSMYTETHCNILDLPAAGHQSWDHFDVRRLKEVSFNFSTLILSKIKLPLRTLLIEDTNTGNQGIVCFDIDIEVIYNNMNRDGQIGIELISKPKQASCQGFLSESKQFLILRCTNDFLVMIFAILSISLCFRSLWRAYKFMNYTQLVLRSRNKRLTWNDKREFFDGWLVLIIVNDLMILSATVIIYSYDARLLETNNYTICSLLLGLGNFLTWAGLLRYLSFFEKYNLLLLTLKKSTPHVMRFMLCTTLIYCGFCFCGWIVFGPYHFKFRQLSTTTECLFSLINGDDMFETFALLRSDIGAIWWFSRIYLYLFVSLFIYVVLSLFIALIMDAYEVIKHYSESGFPRTRLQSLYLDADLTRLRPIAVVA